MAVPKPTLSDPPTEDELIDLLQWLRVKIRAMSPMVAGWRQQRADAMRALHDDHGHTLRMLARDNGMSNPSVLESIKKARQRSA